ncbi:spore germination protein KB [Paenibacillus algorifonticola]|uniref:Spore germination protein KB n=1 Tax=Paenibacillus algorifonticola TaxID=684063 RepID=A0A1I2FHN3_9BACL|nr:GerAB/ArcD/ProY family transporter [Paenibacillus algorifonticola]SFF04389.1 spore germination protein KB [Paenibacillus algorifonticola]
MNKQTISQDQLIVLFFVYLTGSVIVNLPGPLIGFAHNGVWISLLLSGTVAMIQLLLVLYLDKEYPGQSFSEYSQAVLGTWPTIVIVIPFISLLFEMSTDIVHEVGKYANSSLMRQTPQYIFDIFIFTTVAITVRAGIEVMSRMFTILIFIMMLFIVLTLLFSIPNYHTEFLFPILPDGIKPVLHGAYLSYGFTHAEPVLLALLLPFVRRPTRNLHKKLVIVFGISIILLIAVAIATILVFGPLAGERKYSMVEVARMIDLQPIQRVEFIVGIALIVGSYMKACITIFILNQLVVRICKLKDEKVFILPLTFINMISAFLLQRSEAKLSEHITVILPIWKLTGFTIPLLLVVAIHLLKKMLGLQKTPTK